MRGYKRPNGTHRFALAGFLAFFAISLSVCSTTSHRPAAGFTGTVVGVSDGDTITVLDGQKPRKVRLARIDCPEKAQPFGQRAKQFTAQLAFRKEVTVEVRGKEFYNRVLAEVILPDGRSLNEELVRAGLAWWYRKYAPHDKQLAALEESARRAKRGVWSLGNPAPPWKFRSTAKHAKLPER